MSDPSGFRRHTVGSPAGCLCVACPRRASSADNKLQSVTASGQTTTFVYDGNGARGKKVDPSGTTYYVGGVYEKLVATSGVTEVTTTSQWC